tara:strand:- start:42 stop:698 length:657 start_codon:yes stop_codon:yes gene_type:complete
MAKVDLKIDWATHEAAKYACKNWHYSGCMPVAKIVKIGIWEGGKFIGVVLFSKGTCGHLFNRFGLDKKSGCELTRVALTTHKTPVSKIISIALRFLKAQSPGLRLIVSFAAKSEGHHGGIYQAGNWIYDGETTFKQEYMLNGKRITDRTVSSWVLKGKIKRSNLIKASSDTKHRYLMPLDKEMKAQIAPLAKPYPKREKQAMAVPTAQRRGSADLHAP